MASSNIVNEQPTCRTIGVIQGLPGRKNVVISPAVNWTGIERDSHVVYFPGDVQGFAQEMALHRVGKKWVKWSFENTATILQERFPTSWIWIIGPHRFHESLFSCYDNFVECNIIGSPIDFQYRDSTKHLQLLLQGACRSLENILTTNIKEGTKKVQVFTHYDDCKKSVDENMHKETLVNPYLPLKLVGFSKGCVVLNQIVSEMKQTQEANTELKSFVEQICAIYWLDGGHSGEESTWVTDREVLEVLAKTGISIHAHVTPYQVDDVARPWIAEEHKIFLEVLKELEGNVTEKLHFETEERSLGIHFKLLKHF
ncbi:UPF0565 protein C2orf69 homolog [Anneissia japonica]|uniref:UPF0565 protein C2orf69 homolog n=1 Tax=Anneissia japonica TaxID=1529436 RepID=UPI0014256A9F|nr:UPF0565 protein C2orf69 homolog [Anneissia japonica]